MYLSCLQDQVVARDICFGIDIQSPMEEFAKNEDSEKELGIIETFKKFMNGTHSAQMVISMTYFAWIVNKQLIFFSRKSTECPYQAKIQNLS